MEKEIGKITHYFDQIGVAVVKLQKGSLKVGDSIKIVGGDVNFQQAVESLEVDHQSVQSATTGDEFGLKVDQKVHEGYKVYLV